MKYIYADKLTWTLTNDDGYAFQELQLFFLNLP